MERRIQMPKRSGFKTGIFALCLSMASVLISGRGQCGYSDWSLNQNDMNDGSYQPRPDARFFYYVNPNLGHLHLTVAERLDEGGWHQDLGANHVVFGLDAERGRSSEHSRYYYYGNYLGADRWGYTPGQHGET